MSRVKCLCTFVPQHAQAHFKPFWRLKLEHAELLNCRRACAARTSAYVDQLPIFKYLITGMVLGPILGTIIGLFIPDSIRMSASTLQIPVLNAITSSRFETVSLFAFLFCILGTLVGVWVSGKNYKPQK